MDHKKVKSQKLPACRTGRKAKSWLGGFNFVPLVFGAQPTPLGQIGGKPQDGFGPWGNLGISTSVDQAAKDLISIISRIIGIMTIIAGIWFIFQFITGAFSYMTAGGDQQKIGNANKKITFALIGLIVVIISYAIMSLLSELLGFKFLDLLPLIQKLGP